MLKVHAQSTLYTYKVNKMHFIADNVTIVFDIIRSRGRLNKYVIGIN